MPVSDAEDASLALQSVGQGRLHPLLSVDLRNSDDAAGLARLPGHVQVGFVYHLGGGGGASPGAWVEALSSSGFHVPDAREWPSPRQARG